MLGIKAITTTKIILR